MDRRLAALGIELPKLEEAARFTAERVEIARRALRERLGDETSRVHDGIDIVVAGSIAREEMTGESDFDYFLLARALVENVGLIEEYRRAADYAREQIGALQPGTTGIFGRMIPASDFVDLIGLEEDSNRNQTRRVLFLEESRSLWQDAQHAEVRRRVLERYLYDYTERKKQGVPRFLMNDVVRYWRTVAVDYQAKRWDEAIKSQKKWGLRYLKLRISRKLSFAAALVALYWPTLQGEPTTVDALAEQFSIPSLGRLAQLGTVVGDNTRESLLEIFRIADDFAGFLSRPESRAAAAAGEHPDEAEEGSEFDVMRKASFHLQELLETVFFSDSEVGQLTKKYLSF